MAEPVWPRAVAFDLDGTLVDTAPDLHDVTNRLLAEHGRPGVSLAQVRSMVGDGARVLLERGFSATGGWPDGLDPAEAVRRFVEIYSVDPARLSQPFEGVRDTLELLRRQGVKLGVCTNKPQKPTDLLLRGLDLHEHFDSVIGGDALPVRKPDPGHLAAVLDGMGARPDEAVLVGDSHNDVAAARGLGVPCILVAYGYTSTPVGELGGHAIIENFAALIDSLAALAPGAPLDSAGSAQHDPRPLGGG
jgi:phosphoglycolate phosphatase